MTEELLRRDWNVDLLVKPLYECDLVQKDALAEALLRKVSLVLTCKAQNARAFQLLSDPDRAASAGAWVRVRVRSTVARDEREVATLVDELLRSAYMYVERFKKGE